MARREMENFNNGNGCSSIIATGGNLGQYLLLDGYDTQSCAYNSRFRGGCNAVSRVFAGTTHPEERGSYLPHVHVPDLCWAALRNGQQVGEQPR